LKILIRIFLGRKKLILIKILNYDTNYNICYYRYIILKFTKCDFNSIILIINTIINKQKMMLFLENMYNIGYHILLFITFGLTGNI